MASFLPAFMAGWDLPSFPVLALSSSLQRRILSFVLKRTLGKFVHGGQLELEQIDAGIGSGQIEIRNVQLDALAINAQLPQLPITFLSGQLGRVHVQLPFPNIWSGELKITVNDVQAQLRIKDCDSQIMQNNMQETMSASFASAASELLVQDEEGRDLEQSIHDTLATEASDANNIEPASVVSSYVEALLARLKVSIQSVRIDVLSDILDLSVQLKQANLQSTSTKPSDLHKSSSGRASDANKPIAETIRALELQGLDICIGASTTSWTQSAAPVVQEAANLQDSVSTIYESAILQDSSQTTYEPALEPTEEMKPQPRKILSTGSDPVTITMTTTKEYASSAAAPSSRTAPSLRLTKIDVKSELCIGHVAVMTTFDIIVPLNAILQRISQKVNATAYDSSPTVKASITTGVSLICHIKTVTVVLVYDDPLEQVAENAAFWDQPKKSHPASGHLWVFCERLDAHYMAAASSSAESVNFSLSDARLYEHLSPRLSKRLPVGAHKLLPVLVFDHNLAQSADPGPQSYGSRPSRNYVETLDWRSGSAARHGKSSPRSTRFEAAEQNNAFHSSSAHPYLSTSHDDRGWKVKSRHKSKAGPHTDSDAIRPACVSASLTKSAASGQSQVSVSLVPLHLFLDVSLVTRLLSTLKPIASQIGASQRQDYGHDMSTSMASLAASTATLQALSRPQSVDEKKKTQLCQVVCHMIRVELRVPQFSPSDMEPAASTSKGAQILGLSRRGGLAVLDIHDLDLQLGLHEKDQRKRGVHFLSAASFHEQLEESGLVTGRINVASLAAYQSTIADDSRAHRILTLEAINDEPIPIQARQSQGTRLLPRLIISTGSETHDSNDVKEQYSCLIPAISVELDKESTNSLQYTIDDLSQWSAFWARDYRNFEEDSIGGSFRILGSRFFSSRSVQSVISMSTDSTSTADSPSKRSAFAARITDITARLRLPRSAEDLHYAAQDLVLRASDVEVLSQNDSTSSTNFIDAYVTSLSLTTESDDPISKPVQLVNRTMTASLDSPSHRLLTLKIEAYTEPDTSHREQNVNLIASGLTVSPLFSDSLLVQIKFMLKPPAGVFENVEPTEVTRISAKVRDCTVYVAVPDCDHRAALVLGEVSVKTKLTSRAPQTTAKLALANVNLFVLDQQHPQLQGNRDRPTSTTAYWLGLGYSRIINVSECKGVVHLNTLTRLATDVKLTKSRVKVQICADTMEVFSSLVSSLTSSLGQNKSDEIKGDAKRSDNDSDVPMSRSRSHSNVSESSYDTQATTDLLTDIDDEAFVLNAPVSTGADLIDDDMPSDPTFLGAKGRYHPDLIETSLDDDEFFGGDSVASLSLAEPRSNRVVFADEEVTIRILDPNGIRPIAKYFTDPNLRPATESLTGSEASSLRIRVTDFDLSLRLHSGYDWFSTQTVVEEEAKRVRKRLQKIKQLLAEGQIPDDSVEAATSNLLDSVYISLPQNRADMDPSGLMQAMDDELGDFSETGSAASSQGTSDTWQSMPAPHQPSSNQARPNRRNKLQRSVRSVIEFNFSGLEVEIDQLDPTGLTDVTSRIAVTALSFEIIDNVKTSTWRTFLTEMKDADSAMRMDEHSRMVKIEVVTVRSGATVQPSSNANEFRVRARIAPLRLHVDQDALDFLKKFFAFKLPAAKSSTGKQPDLRYTESAGVGPFIQSAEVLPIRLKLDYKPKRVDYNLLRQGKTIELMNFFHFEGAEMVLRHVTLRGITGWARLFDTLNDIWTPDVKANQLADVLSGVAPIRSLVNVGAGLADLVLLPIEHYQKDGRFLRGVQKGATSFVKSTALEAVKLGARLATGTQVILEQAEHILGGRMADSVTARAIGPEGQTESYSSLSESMMLPPQDGGGARTNIDGRRTSEENASQFSRYASQPADMEEALLQAYSGLSRGLTSAAQTILAVPMEVYEPSASSSSSSTPVVRAVPIAILRGARGATEAIAKTMQGVQASLGDRQATQEGKYKQDPRRVRPRPS